MDKASVTRIVILAVALINQLLAAYGKSPIPVEDETLEQFIATAFTIAAGLWAAWKNNYLAEKGKKQKEVLKRHDLD